jgi:hypothetical protein
MQGTNKRIDEFIKVATTRYGANPKVWDYIYNQLHSLLPKDEKAELEKAYYPIRNKKELDEWDELFIETTIDETKLAKQFTDKDEAEQQRQAYEQQLMQQQMNMRNAMNYPNAYQQGYSVSTAPTAGGIYPVETHTPPTLVDRLLGRK